VEVPLVLEAVTQTAVPGHLTLAIWRHIVAVAIPAPVDHLLTHRIHALAHHHADADLVLAEAVKKD
jgi:hypothetical protein